MMNSISVSSLSAAREPVLADDLQLSEVQFYSAFEDTAVGMALVGLDSCSFRVNTALCAMLGYTEDELTGMGVGDVTYPEDVDEDLRQRDLLLAGSKRSYQREKRYLRKNGRIAWGHLSCTLVRDRAGRALHFVAQVQDITERKLTEQALRASEERFRSLTILSVNWYWEQDSQFRFTHFCGGERGRWAKDQQAAVGKRRWELECLVPLNSTWEQHRATLEAHQPFHDFQYMRARGDEPVRYLCCSGEPVFDEGHRFTGYRGTARDITEAKQAEQRLKETQSVLDMAAQLGRLGAWAYEIGQPTLYWSPEVCATHDVTVGHAPTLEQSLAYFTPEYRDTVRAALQACMLDGTPFDIEAQLISAAGRRIWTHVLGEAEWNEKGQVRRIHGACQDVTDRRKSAEQAQKMVQFLTTTLESLTDAFFTIDRDWRFSYVNAEAERLLKRPRKHLLGKAIWSEFPELRESSFQRFFGAALLNNAAVQFEEFYLPWNIWLQVKAYPSRQGLAVYVRDVTERICAQREVLRLNAELEERVRQRTMQLEAANRELESFSYSVAHDLRAPIGTIEGFSRLLLESGSTPHPRSAHYLARINAAGRQMSDLISGLLALANLSRGELESGPVDLAELARQVIAALRERFPERDVAVAIDDALPAFGDRRLLAQVMENLVANAWKFTGKRTAAEIRVSCTSGESGQCVYFVRDNGAGFDMQRAGKIFEVFQRVHSSSEFEGTGIGLAIVSKIITRHGGRIWAESEVGRGATFCFTLAQEPSETVPLALHELEIAQR